MAKQPRKTKLVRDRYQDIITPEDWIRLGSGSKRHLRELKRKLLEEIDELKASDYRDPEEYGDIIEVLKCLAFFHNVDWSDVEDACYRKMIRKGKFIEGIFLVNIRQPGDEEA